MRPLPRLIPRAALRLSLVSVLSGVPAASALAASTRGSFDRPPYAHGKAERLFLVGHVTVNFRHEPHSLDPVPDRSPVLAAILDSLRVEIDRLGLTAPLAVDVRLQGQPDVRFGARRGGSGPDGSPRTPDEIDPSEPRRMVFEVEGPGKMWRRDVKAALGERPAVVSVQLGFDEWWVRQKDWKGNKVIDLGEGRSMELPWLTSLDDPVHVLQITGALVSREGKVLRVAAEGLTARRTGMAASMLGAQETIRDEDLRAVLEPDASGAPVYRTALRALIARLLEPPRGK